MAIDRRGKIKRLKVMKPDKTKDPSGGVSESDHEEEFDRIWAEQLPDVASADEDLDDGTEEKVQRLTFKIYHLPDLDTDMVFEEVDTGNRYEIKGINPPHGLPREQEIKVVRYIS